MAWTIGYYSPAVQREILALPATLQARYIHLTQRMIVFGADLGMPHTRAMGDGLFELRLRAPNTTKHVCVAARIGDGETPGEVNIVNIHKTSNDASADSGRNPEQC